MDEESLEDEERLAWGTESDIEPLPLHGAETQHRYIDQAQSLANVGSWYIDIETGDLEWSDEVYRIFERPLGSQISYEEFQDAVHPADRRRVMDAWEASQDGEPYEVEHRIQVDGKTKWVAQQAEVAFDEAGRPIGGMGVIQDITERREREQLLRVTDRLLRHNLRNDLTVIRGNAVSIREDCDGADADRAETIVEMSDGLLGMGRKARTIHEVVQQDIDKVEVDLGRALVAEAETVQSEFPDAEIGIERSGNPVVTAIPHIEAAIAELLRNAIEHNPRDRPRVAASVTGDGEEVTVRIADDGPGIPEIERTIVTRDRTIDPVHHGSGLGLWMVHWIVHRSMGRLGFAERETRGSVVTITLGVHLERA